MSSSLPNASLFQSRPPRPLANSSKPLQATSRLTPANISSAAVAAVATPQPHSPVSSVPLFLTNLRLLDLDLRPDWPDLNSLTFSTKDATQGQKKRIQCVEWALYQLFCLWDPDEARNKLQPFFPPLDQVQSLNLRAALLRCLEQAKKNGVLGRDVLIRKTMLDECKGERIEEVLAVFSSAVLKKLVAEQQLNQAYHPALAQALALENRGYSGQTTDLSILAVAHRASLSCHLRDKDAARARYRDFSEVLDLKERSLVRRREQSKDLVSRARETGTFNDVDEHVQRDIGRTVRNNWSGSERWMETLLHGDVHAREDSLLSTPFDEVWRRVQEGRLTELEAQHDGLLQQLERRVKTQKERLDQWRAFRDEIGGPTSLKSPRRQVHPSERQRGIDLGFGAHENLQLGRLSPRKLPRGRPGELSADYASIINGLRSELEEASKPTTPNLLVALRPRGKTAEQQLEPAAEDVVSEISELEEEEHPASADHENLGVAPGFKLASTLRQHAHSPRAWQEPEITDEDEPSTVQQQHFSPKQTQPQIKRIQQYPTSAPHTKMVQTTTSVSPPPVRRTPSPRPASPPRVSPVRAPRASASPPKSVQALGDQSLSPTQALADQSLASMDAASPSPTKKPRHTLSLAERTRLSMARRNLKGPNLDVDEDDEPDLMTFTLRPAPSVTVSPAPPDPLITPTEEPDGRGFEDLVSRTRRSMVGFEAAKKKAQLERRRSQRQSSRPTPAQAGHRRDGSSYFPAVDEEAGDTTILLAEELMANEQDDYEAIFKSRPKIKTSPVGSPVKEWED